MFNLSTEIFGDVIVVHTPDELGDDQLDEFESYLTSLDRKNVVIDLDNTESLDSVTLTSLLNSSDALREKNGNLKITSSNSVNRKILEITRIDRQLEVFQSVIDAVTSFS